MGLSTVYNSFIYRFAKITFNLWQNFGFHLTPNHFYQPIPDTSKLRNELWLKESSLIGIDFNEEAQSNILTEFSEKFKLEYESFPEKQTSIPHQFYKKNIFLGAVDAEILHCMVRYLKPKRIIEIGSGFSTYVSAQAILENKKENGCECELIAIEPYPNSVLKGGFPGLSELKSVQVQEVPVTEFLKLEENDILFIDSSHVLKIGGDVQYEFLEILPRLKSGVVVHVHDIFLPAEYPRELIYRDKRFYTEQYLLQAFLTFNSHFEIIWAASYMHLKHPEKLEAAFSSYKRNSKHIPGSFWIKRIK